MFPDGRKVCETLANTAQTTPSDESRVAIHQASADGAGAALYGMSQGVLSRLPWTFFDCGRRPRLNDLWSRRPAVVKGRQHRRPKLGLHEVAPPRVQNRRPHARREAKA